LHLEENGTAQPSKKKKGPEEGGFSVQGDNVVIAGKMPKGGRGGTSFQKEGRGKGSYGLKADRAKKWFLLGGKKWTQGKE